MAPRKKKIMRAFRIDRVSCVDVPAQEDAVFTLMKRYTPEDEDGKDEGSEEKTEKRLADILTDEDDTDHQHAVYLSIYDGKLSVDVSYTGGHSHPVVKDTDGNYKFGIEDGHTHEVNQRKMRRAVKSALKVEVDRREGIMSTIGKNEDQIDETTVDDEETEEGLDELRQQVADQADTNQDLQKALDRVNSVLKLNSEERSHFDALDEKAQDAFLAKSSDDRKSEMEDAEESDEEDDPVVAKFNGVDIRKSDGVVAAELAKSLQSLHKENIVLKAAREREAYEKRAREEFKNLPGKTDTHVAILKALDTGIDDDDVRKAAMEVFRAHDNGISKSLETRGHQKMESDLSGEEDIQKSADGKLDKLAKSLSDKEKITYEEAYTKVLESDAGMAIYSEAYG